ncbi:MAG TPA: hypothetical protein VM264_10110, partial [Acidimicrobiales bacterium]|nr:hypothetical protein [Acidimicrobiales bacterium]
MVRKSLRFAVRMGLLAAVVVLLAKVVQARRRENDWPITEAADWPLLQPDPVVPPPTPVEPPPVVPDPDPSVPDPVPAPPLPDPTPAPDPPVVSDPAPVGREAPGRTPPAGPGRVSGRAAG